MGNIIFKNELLESDQEIKMKDIKLIDEQPRPMKHGIEIINFEIEETDKSNCSFVDNIINTSTKTKYNKLIRKCDILKEQNILLTQKYNSLLQDYQHLLNKKNI